MANPPLSQLEEEAKKLGEEFLQAAKDASSVVAELRTSKAELKNFVESTKSLSSGTNELIKLIPRQQSAVQQSITALLTSGNGFRDLKKQLDAKNKLLQVDIDIAKNLLNLAKLRQAAEEAVLIATQDKLNTLKSTGGDAQLISSLEAEVVERQKALLLLSEENKLEEIRISKEMQGELDRSTKELKMIKWQVMATAVNNLQKATETISSVSRNIQNQFGITGGSALNLAGSSLTESVKSYVESIASGFQTFGVTQDEILQTISDYQNEFGQILDTEAAANLAEQAKKMGVTTQQFATARRVFTTQTLGNVGDAIAAQEKFISSFERKGLTSKTALQEIAKNSELLARNGIRFADSFANAAASARKIGVDLSKVDQVGDSIIGNFEGFLEKSAELGAMGFGFDVNRLAEIAERGDTGALFNELRSQLAVTGKNLQDLTRSQQLSISEAFGLPMAELQRLISSETGAGEKTVDPQELTNSLLERSAIALDAISKGIAFMGSVIGGVIAASSIITAGATTITAIATAPLAAAILGVTVTLGALALAIGAFFGLKKFFEQKPPTNNKLAEIKPLTSTTTPLQSQVAPLRRAMGGIVRGQGTDRSDSILTRLSNGEYVINARSVQIPGMKNVLDLINSGRVNSAREALEMYRKGGLRGAVTSLTSGSLGKLAKGGIGKLIGGTLGSAIPIPGIGTAIGSILGSGVGKALGGLFGKRKKQDPITTSLGTDKSKIDLSTMLPLLMSGAAAAAPKQAEQVKVDISNLEKKFDQLVAAFGNIQVNLDGNKVGQLLVANDQRAASVGVFRAQRSN